MEILHEIPQSELDEIAEISQRCHKLHAVAPIMATVELEVADLKTGEVLTRYGDLSRSWTRNYYNHIVCQTFDTAPGALGNTFGAGYLKCKEVTGTNVPWDAINQLWHTCANEMSAAYGWRGEAANGAKGIGVGTDDTAESIDDYKLGAPIADGSSPGQMNYQVMAAPIVSWLGTPDFKFKCVGTRMIINTGGGSIDIKEAGINMATSSGNVCFVRDVLGAAVTCPDPSQITVTYTLYSPSLGA